MGGPCRRPAPCAVKLLKVWHDEWTNPRNYDNLGVMVCWHRRYTLGDRHNYRTPDEFLEWAKKADVALRMPLYIYSHSGVTISTEGWRYPFNDPWDSCQVGWIYTTKERLRRWFGVKRVTQKVIKRAEEMLLNEVKEYDCYLRGDVYGFTVYSTDPWKKLASYSGFIGSDPTKNGMTECIEAEFPEFKEKLSVVTLRDSLIITEDGAIFDGQRELRELIHRVFPEEVVEKYFAVRELVG